MYFLHKLFYYNCVVGNWFLRPWSFLLPDLVICVFLKIGATSVSYSSLPTGFVVRHVDEHSSTLNW